MPINIKAELASVESSRIRHSGPVGVCHIPGESDLLKALSNAHRKIMADPVAKRKWFESQIEISRELGIPEEEIPTIEEFMERW